MQTVTDLLFFLLLSLLFMHELDAIRRHEWRMFIILNKFEDEKAFQIFSLLHLPLFILIFWLLAQPVVLIHFWFQVGLDLFLLVHKILHDHFQQHPANQFDNRFSRRVIDTMAVGALIHLGLVFGLTGIS